MMKERPILFNGEMVRAILANKKTQTRRPVKVRPGDYLNPEGGKITVGECDGFYGFCSEQEVYPSPFGRPGDCLWVRETWYVDHHDADSASTDELESAFAGGCDLYYRADGECCHQIPECACAEVGPPRWRPSIHMPRWASRITLKVAGTRVERLSDIRLNSAAIEAEGCSLPPTEVYPHCNRGDKLTRVFREMWDGLYALTDYSWVADPWVWVVEFTLESDSGKDGDDS